MLICFIFFVFQNVLSMGTKIQSLKFEKMFISVTEILTKWIEASKVKLFFCVTFSDIINIFFSLILPAVHVMRIYSSLPAMCSPSDLRLPLLSATEFSHHICDEESFKSHFGFWSIITDHFYLKFHAMQLKKNNYTLHINSRLNQFFRLFHCSFPLWFPLNTVVWGISSNCINFSLMISIFYPLSTLRDCLCFICQVSL